jgi:hypothetical protein
MKQIKYLVLCISITLCNVAVSFSQGANKFDFERIEDNSFLIEEAYNQEPGVIQHISAFQYMKGNTWLYTFTDEWPVPRERHQLSFTLPVLNNGYSGFGDLALNYRYQAILRTQLAFSPRISLIIPTGNNRKGLGAGAFGYQISLPFSYLISRLLVTHYNLGLTITPNERRMDGSRFSHTTYNYGVSLILLISKSFNFMFEVAGNRAYEKSNNNKTIVTNSLFVNPGFRYAINFKSGLQIVPGLAVPIGVGSSSGASGLFAYLSFEHPFWKP